MITLVCEQIRFSAQKQTFTSSKALNSLSLTLIHSPTLPIPFINSICTSFTFNSGSARTIIAWAEREHENGHIFISCSTGRIYPDLASSNCSSQKRGQRSSGKSTLMTKLYRDRCRALIGCLRVLHFSRASNNQSMTLQGSLWSYVISMKFSLEKLGGPSTRPQLFEGYPVDKCQQNKTPYPMDNDLSGG